MIPSEEYCCESIAFYCNNTIVLKCIRSFSLHDFSFSLAYEAMLYIQSTSSIILDSSTSAVVPTQSLIYGGKLFPFGALFDEQIKRFTRHFLEHGLPPFNRFLKFLRKRRQVDVCNMSTLPF